MRFIKAKVKELSLSQQSEVGAILLHLCYPKCPVGSWALCLYSWPPYASEKQDHMSNVTQSSHLGQGQGNASIPDRVTTSSHSTWPWLLTFENSGLLIMFSALGRSGARTSSDMCASHTCLKHLFPTWRSWCFRLSDSVQRLRDVPGHLNLMLWGNLAPRC